MFTTEPPTQPGIYKVRGFEIGKRLNEQVVVVVEHNGELRTSLHDRSDIPAEHMYRVTQLNPNIAWEGPYTLPSKEAV